MEIFFSLFTSKISQEKFVHFFKMKIYRILKKVTSRSAKELARCIITKSSTFMQLQKNLKRRFKSLIFYLIKWIVTHSSFLNFDKAVPRYVIPRFVIPPVLSNIIQIFLNKKFYWLKSKYNFLRSFELDKQLANCESPSSFILIHLDNY